MQGDACKACVKKNSAAFKKAGCWRPKGENRYIHALCYPKLAEPAVLPSHAKPSRVKVGTKQAVAETAAEYPRYANTSARVV